MQLGRRLTGSSDEEKHEAVTGSGRDRGGSKLLSHRNTCVPQTGCMKTLKTKRIDKSYDLISIFLYFCQTQVIRHRLKLDFGFTQIYTATKDDQ